MHTLWSCVSADNGPTVWRRLVGREPGAILSKYQALIIIIIITIIVALPSSTYYSLLLFILFY